MSVSLTAGFFTLLYGISFGKNKQEKWLTALVVSVFQDVLISQPLKIFAIALFVAFIIRKPSPPEVREENEELLRDQEWIQQSLLQVYKIYFFVVLFNSLLVVYRIVSRYAVNSLVRCIFSQKKTLIEVK